MSKKYENSNITISATKEECSCGHASIIVYTSDTVKIKKCDYCGQIYEKTKIEQPLPIANKNNQIEKQEERQKESLPFSARIRNIYLSFLNRIAPLFPFLLLGLAIVFTIEGMFLRQK